MIFWRGYVYPSHSAFRGPTWAEAFGTVLKTVKHGQPIFNFVTIGSTDTWK